MKPSITPTKTTTKRLADIWSNYHPLIGLYDSTDPDLLECHLLQMKLAGIDGVIPDWYGSATRPTTRPFTRPAALSSTPVENSG